MVPARPAQRQSDPLGPPVVAGNRPRERQPRAGC